MSTISRDLIPENLKWDLSPLFANEAAFEGCFAEAEALIDGFSAFAGRLNRSGRILLQALQHDDEMSKKVDRLYFFSQLCVFSDAGDKVAEVRLGRVKDLNDKAGKVSAFFRPQLTALKPERLAAFIKKVPGLAAYSNYLDRIMCDSAHVRSQEVEEVLADTARVLGAPKSTYDVFVSMILPKQMPMVPTEDGKEVHLDDQVYARHLGSANRAVRQGAWEGMMQAFGNFGPLLAQIYASRVASSISSARARKYSSTLEHALSGPRLPVSVYDTLISTVRANVPLLQRYLELRKKLLGLDELHMYDLYVPLVVGMDGELTFEEAKADVLEALKIMGPDYISRIQRAFDSRRIDVMPNKGKRGGAFSWGIYGIKPYVSLNWSGRARDGATLAHELGHNMHSEYIQEQVYVDSGYPTFCAEVASTVNEQLLLHYQLSKTTDARRRLFLLNSQLEGVRTTIVRQTLFADFERQAHSLAEAGTTLTEDVLCNLFKRINEEYYGPAVVIDDLVRHEWSRIPHFMNPFYVFTYATGLSAAITIADKIIEEGQPAAEAHIGFLTDGYSKLPLQSLAGAGADLSTPEPVERAFAMFAKTLDAFEAEIARL